MVSALPWQIERPSTLGYREGNPCPGTRAQPAAELAESGQHNLHQLSTFSAVQRIRSFRVSELKLSMTGIAEHKGSNRPTAKEPFGTIQRQFHPLPIHTTYFHKINFTVSVQSPSRSPRYGYLDCSTSQPQHVTANDPPELTFVTSIRPSFSLSRIHLWLMRLSPY
jgi:hypothetical protein